MNYINTSHFSENLDQSISFSPNLKRFLSKNWFYSQVFKDPITGIYYVGLKDEKGHFFGAKFLHTLTMGAKAQTFSLPMDIANRLVEKTNQFWKCTAHFGRRMFRKWYWN